MGIQFRLGPGDHKPVEDFLSRDHAGTTAITLDTNATRHQHDGRCRSRSRRRPRCLLGASSRAPRRAPGFGLDKFPL